MIKRGKYYVPPYGDASDFKELFRRVVSEGAGRSVDKAGLPAGPWTPELLAEAISRIEANSSGIDLRTVQRWFQANNQGIKSDNIRWLATVFGCGDPDAIMKWQIELNLAQQRLMIKRRSNRKTKRPSEESEVEIQLRTNVSAESRTRSGRVSLALRAERMFGGRSSLNLPILIWANLSALWFLSYIFGIHSVTYSPIGGIGKQVGFFWSPAWNVGEMICVPIFTIACTEVLGYWKFDGRPTFFSDSSSLAWENASNWETKLESFSASYWIILIVSFGVIFLVQWAGVYLTALLNNNAGRSMVDWLLVATVRPDVVSIPEAIGVSFLAFLYSGMIYWIFFNGLLMMYTVVNDFYNLCAAPNLYLTDSEHDLRNTIGLRIMSGVYRGTLLGIWLAICIKLNAAYLISDGATFATWLLNDTLFALGRGDISWTWLNKNPSPFFTSFLLLFIICFVFFTSLAQIIRSVGMIPATETIRKRQTYMYSQMVGVVILLTCAFFLIGQFAGFSILLGVSVLVSASSFYGSMRVSYDT